MLSATIYTTPTCKYCHVAKDILKKRGYVIQEYDVAGDKARRMEMIELSKQMGVPVVVIDGKVLVGSDKVEKYLHD